MSLNFIPYTLGQGGVVELDACMSRSFRDADVFTDGRGAFVIAGPGEAEMSILMEAAKRWHEALRQGALAAVVEHPETGSFRRIPRLYWLHVDSLEMRLSVPDDMPTTGYDAAMAGAPVLIPEADLTEWDAIVAKVRGLRAIEPDTSKPKAVVCTPKTKGEISRWLVDQFTNPDNAALRKTDFATQAAQVFEGRFTGRGFVAAWDLAAKNFPKRRAPGRRKSD